LIFNAKEQAKRKEELEDKEAGEGLT